LLPYYYRNAITNKDTVISTRTYHQLFYSLTDSTFTNPINYYYIGGLRENNKQIFFIPKDSINEYLIYDFSLGVGDTIRYDYSVFSGYYGFGPFDSLFVSSVDSVLIYDGTFRKRINFSSWSGGGFPVPIFYSQWIEGIGNNMGLLCPIPNIPTNGTDNQLVCFKQNDTLLCSNVAIVSYFGTCYPIITQLSEPNLDINRIEVFPNPVTGTSLIKWNKNAHITMLEIFNVFGKTILKTKINNVLDYTIDGHIYVNGVYFIKLSDNNGNIYIKKFIKQ
jgi:hypothetical protein